MVGFDARLKLNLLRKKFLGLEPFTKEGSMPPLNKATQILYRPLAHVTKVTRERLYGKRKGTSPPGIKTNVVNPK